MVNRAGVVDPCTAWQASEKGKEELEREYVGKRISKKFTCRTRPFLGSVRHVHWVQSDAQYCMHVNYDSDSDSEDMEEWEVKSRLYTVDSDDSDSD